MSQYEAEDIAQRYLQMKHGGGNVSAKGQYALSHLLRDVTGPGLTEDVVKEVWHSIADFIVETFAKKKGVVVPGLATFSLFKKTFVKVFRPAASFKSELSCMMPATAPEVPCMQLPHTVIAVKAAVAQEKVDMVLKRIILQLGHEARNGGNLCVPLGGLGIFWSRANSFGFNFNKKPMKAAERKKTLRERALAKKRAAEEDALLEAELAAEVNAQADGEEPATQNNQEEDPGDSMANLENARDALDDLSLEQQLDREVLDGQGEMSLNDILEKYAQDTPEARRLTLQQKKQQAAIEEAAYRRENHLPAFLIPDRHRGRQFNVAERQKNEKVLEGLLEEELAKSEELAARQQEQLLLRHQRAELEHRAKLLRKKRQQKEVLADMARQAEEKRKRDIEEEHNRRMLVNPDAGRAIPQQIDPDKREVAKIQGELRQLLDQQVLEKKIAKRMEKKKTVQQERYFLDSLHRQLVQDRNYRQKQKLKNKHDLMANWEKQASVAKKYAEVRKKMYVQ